MLYRQSFCRKKFINPLAYTFRCDEPKIEKLVKSYLLRQSSLPDLMLELTMFIDSIDQDDRQDMSQFLDLVRDMMITAKWPEEGDFSFAEKLERDKDLAVLYYHYNWHMNDINTVIEHLNEKHAEITWENARKEAEGFHLNEKLFSNRDSLESLIVTREAFLNSHDYSPFDVITLLIDDWPQLYFIDDVTTVIRHLLFFCEGFTLPKYADKTIREIAQCLCAKIKKSELNNYCQQIFGYSIEELHVIVKKYEYNAKKTQEKAQIN